MIEEFPHLDAARRAILEAALPIAAFDGWTRKTLIEAARDAGLPDGADELYLPRGPVDLIDFWGRECDLAMENAYAAAETADMKVRERVTFAVMARLEPMRGDREAARRALARLSLPDAGGTAPRILWRAADSIWRAMGDKSTDGNWYSKRATLSGVIGSTFAVFLEDQDPEMAETRAFLDRRIGNVMEFEKAKANFRRFKSALPDPLKTLSKLRYGGVKRYN